MHVHVVDLHVYMYMYMYMCTSILYLVSMYMYMYIHVCACTCILCYQWYSPLICSRCMKSQGEGVGGGGGASLLRAGEREYRERLRNKDLEIAEQLDKIEVRF